jgi:hypothetical protein
MACILVKSGIPGDMHKEKRLWCKNIFPQFDTIILTFVHHFPGDEND